MSRRKKHELPGWFPFAIGSAAVIALFAGARSGWKFSGDQPKTATPTPTPQVNQAGVVQDWAGVSFG